VRFNMAELWYGYTGTADDVIATEIPEHWLQAAK
jgi:thiocyanate hydrolase subunit beta